MRLQYIKFYMNACWGHSTTLTSYHHHLPIGARLSAPICPISRPLLPPLVSRDPPTGPPQSLRHRFHRPTRSTIGTADASHYPWIALLDPLPPSLTDSVMPYALGQHIYPIGNPSSICNGCHSSLPMCNSNCAPQLRGGYGQPYTVPAMGFMTTNAAVTTAGSPCGMRVTAEEHRIWCGVGSGPLVVCGMSGRVGGGRQGPLEGSS